MPIILALLSNRLAQLGLALLAGYLWGWWSTSADWRDRIAKERAAIEYARQVEHARQEAAAREIAAEATKRLEEEQDAVAAMQRQIDDLKRSEAHAPKTNCSDCRVDDDFARRMRGLDAAARKAGAARRAR